MKIHTAVGLGLVLGAATGALVGAPAEALEILGTLFIRLVRMIIVPLVASSLIVAIAGLPGRKTLGRMGIRAFGFIAASLFVALLIGIAFGLALEPGAQLSAEARASLLGASEGGTPPTPPEPPSLVETLLGIVPANVVSAAAEGNILQVLFISVVFGLAASLLPDEKRSLLLGVLSAVAEVMYRLVGWILYLAPLGVFGLMAAVVARSGLGVILTLGIYVLVIVAALATHVLGTYSSVLVLLARQPLGSFYRAIQPALLIAFGTCSTAAALPVSLKLAQDDLGFSPRIATFTLPLGAAVGRDGSGIYQAITVLFIAQFYGQELGAGALGTLVVTAMLSALAVASVPAASFVNLAIILSALGLPLEGAALVLGVERPLDMLRTATNYIGQLTGATYVAATEGELTRGPAPVAASVLDGP